MSKKKERQELVKINKKEFKEYQEVLKNLPKTLQGLINIFEDRSHLNLSKDRIKRFENLIKEVRNCFFNNIKEIIDDYEKGVLLLDNKGLTYLYTVLFKLEQLIKLKPSFNSNEIQKAFKASMSLISETSNSLTLKDKKELFANDTTKKELEYNNLTFENFYVGIPLTPPQTKFILCLMQIFCENKNNKTTYHRPELKVNLYEITRLYTGGKRNINGKDLKQVVKVINELNGKNFTTLYRSKEKKGNSFESDGWKIRRFHEFIKVKGLYINEKTDLKGFDFPMFTKEFDGATNKVKKAKEVIITLLLNPIFSSQLDSSYVLFPGDFIERLNKANGPGNISEITTRLILFLMLKKTFSNSFKISLDKLRWRVAGKWRAESRIKAVNTGLNKAFEVAINMGLLKSYEIDQLTGFITFYLDKDFNKKQISYKEPKRLTINKLNK